MAPQDETLNAVLRVVERRLKDPFSLDGLTRIEGDLIATVSAYGVICNGGHLYWHEGKTPDMTRRVAAAFDRIGLPAVAEALRSSLRAFPGGAPPEDATERHRTIAAHRDELEAKFHGLDQVIWDADYEGAALAYVEANRAALVAIAPEYAALLRLN